MNILSIATVLACLTSLPSLATGGTTENANENIRRETTNNNSKNNVECRLFWKHTQYLGEHDEPNEELECEIESVGGKPSKHGHMKKLGAAQKELIQKNAKEIRSGEYVLSFEDADESGEEIKVRGPKNGRTGKDDGNVGVSMNKVEGWGKGGGGQQGRDRTLVNLPGNGCPVNVTTTGTKTVLAIRIIAPDVATTKSASYISGSIFGSSTDKDKVNLKSHYAECSFNQLHFEKATHANVTDGVLEVNVTSNATGTSSSVIRSEAIAAAEAAVGGDLACFNHVMFCIPPGTTGSWVAYAYTDHWLSVYNDNWCTYVSAQMHEVGHNLRLAHSGEGDLAYGDQSGMMGYSYSQSDSPKMCFNGAKSYQLGWFSDRTFDVNPLNMTVPPFNGNIVGTSEYDHATSSQYVVVKVEAGTKDFYVALNRKNNANSGTLEGSNQIQVTEQGDGYSQSRVLAKLGAGQEHWVTIKDSDNINHDIMIRVNSISLTGIPAVANVDIMEYVAPTISPAPTPAPLSCSGEARLEIFVTTDKYNAETKWSLKKNGNTVGESDPYPDSDKTYTNEMCISDGAYSFNMTDVYGDGFCCSYGDGAYTLMLDGVPILDRAGDIGPYNVFSFVVGEGTTLPPTPSPTKLVTASPTVTPTVSPTTSLAPTSSFVELSPAEDAYVYYSSTKSDANYGSASVLFLKKTSSTDRRALLKFDLGEVPSGTAQGKLRLYVSDLGGSDRSIVVERIADTWDESTVTWNNLNPTVEQVGTTFTVADTDLNTWIEVDVSDVLQTLTGTTLVLMIGHDESSSGNKCVFRSQDYGDGELAPKLLYSSGSAVATISPTASPVTDSPTASSPAPPSSDPVLITPFADTYLYDTAAEAGTNFGTRNNVVISGNRRGLLKFLLGEVPSATASGTLRLYVNAIGGSEPRTLAVRRIADNWEENVVTQISFLPVVQQTGATSLAVTDADLKAWVEVDISDLVRNLGATTLVLMLEHDANSSGGTVTIRGKDYSTGDLAPQLLYSPGADPDPVETTLDATDDAYIWSSDGKSVLNYGTKNTLWMTNNSNDRRVLVKFDVQSLSAGPASEAKLRLFVSDLGNQPSRTIQVSRLADVPAWSQSTVTWDNFSSMEEEIGNTFVVTDSDLGLWVEVDVTDILNSRSGTELSLLLVIVGESNGGYKCVFRSSEYNLAPQLVVLQ